MRHAIGSVLRGTRTTAVSIGTVVLVAAGVPLVWVWIASKIAGTERDLTPSLALFITTGILVSYWLVLLIGGLIRGRIVSEDEETTRHRRMSWNRSFRDEPYSSDRTDPVEVVFVVTAVIAIIAFEIWFLFLAGPPPPKSPVL